MPATCTVLIAEPAQLAPLSQQVTAPDRELLIFTDTDALRALDTIATRRPGLVALGRTFAATPRGAALINRIKADPSLIGTDVRLVPETVEAPLSAANVDAAATEQDDTPSEPTPAPVTAPLDYRGTRRAPRVKMQDALEVLVDGNPAVLVDLSTVGAQVVSPTVLRPNQRVRVTMTDEAGTLRTGGTIVWASFEIPPRIGPRYRAGIEFQDREPAAIDAFAQRHRA